MDGKARKTWLMTLLLLTSAALMANAPVGKTSVTVHASNSSSTSSVSAPKDWSQTYGGSGDEAANSVVQTSDGGYALAGWTDSSGAGLADFWLVKTDSAGNMNWSQTYGGTGDDEAFSMVQTSDRGYAIAGYTTSFGAGYYDFWLVKTDSAGNRQWDKTYGGAGDDEAYSVVQTSDGGYALAGWTDSSGGGGLHFWLVRTDSVGNVIWNQTYGGPGDSEAYSVVQTKDGSYAIAGSTDSSGAGGNDFWLVKTDSNGTTQWNQTYGGVGEDVAYSVTQTGDGGYALAGYTHSFGAGGEFWYYFWLVKTDSVGNIVWNQTYGGPGDSEAFSVVQASDGGYALAGYTDSSGAGGDDFYLVKTDSAGASSSTAGIDWSSIEGYAIIVIIVVIIIGAAWSILARRGRRTDNPNIQRM